jgi:hypothetical protein
MSPGQGRKNGGPLEVLFLEPPLEDGSGSLTPWGAKVRLYLGNTAASYYIPAWLVLVLVAFRGNASLAYAVFSVFRSPELQQPLLVLKLHPLHSMMRLGRSPTCLLCSNGGFCLIMTFTAGSAAPIISALYVVIATRMLHICSVLLVYPALSNPQWLQPPDGSGVWHPHDHPRVLDEETDASRRAGTCF